MTSWGDQRFVVIEEALGALGGNGSNADRTTQYTECLKNTCKSIRVITAFLTSKIDKIDYRVCQ